MRELHRILALWSQVKASGESAVLATVVETKGSSYRLPGARLLLTADGQKAGSISGGCLEEELIKKAWWLTEQGPTVRRYDTNAEGEIGSGFGLGCNGIIDVLLERLQPDEANILDTIQRVIEHREAAVVCHITAPRANVGQRFIFYADGQTLNTVTATGCGQMETEARSALASCGSFALQFGDTHLFVETLQPPVRLLIFGAGDDAIPVTEIASHLGWQTSVYDGRSHYARDTKFPKASEVRVLPDTETDFEIAIDQWTVAVLMTHSYSQDLRALRKLAPLNLRYLGILGPRKRSLQLLQDAGLSELDLAANLHSPMGLDIGADGPDQVALAVAAEIQAVLNGRRGGQLRHGHGSIHSLGPDVPLNQSDEAWTGSIVCA